MNARRETAVMCACQFVLGVRTEAEEREGALNSPTQHLWCSPWVVQWVPVYEYPVVQHGSGTRWPCPPSSTCSTAPSITVSDFAI